MKANDNQFNDRQQSEQDLKIDEQDNVIEDEEELIPIYIPKIKPYKQGDNEDYNNDIDVKEYTGRQFTKKRS